MDNEVLLQAVRLSVREYAITLCGLIIFTNLKIDDAQLNYHLL